MYFFSRILVAMFTLAAVLAAADVSGNWKAERESPQGGTMTRTFAFKVDGNKLTGESVSSFAGRSEIQEGKVDGDTLSFVLNVKIQDQEVKMTYKGKVVSNDAIKLVAEGFGGQTIEWDAKRQK